MISQMKPVVMAPWEGLLATSGNAAEHDGPNKINVVAVGLGAGLIVINAAISLALSLGLEFQLIVSAVRCIVQLTVLGYILVPIFTTPHWYIVISYALFMGLVGAFEASSRPSHGFRGMFLQVLSCTVVTSSVFVTYALVALIRTDPWWEPQYLIPLLGMLLGNCISAISVGLTALLEALVTERPNVELLLALGATRWEAGREIVARCIKLATMPILNTMSVVGIVSIPGMMTGQILGGTNPAQAARYQMLIMFLIAATTATGALSAVFIAYTTIVDNQHRLHPERIQTRAQRKRFDRWLQKWASNFVSKVSDTISHMLGRSVKAERSASGETTGSLREPLVADME